MTNAQKLQELLTRKCFCDRTDPIMCLPCQIWLESGASSWDEVSAEAVTEELGRTELELAQALRRVELLGDLIDWKNKTIAYQQGTIKILLDRLDRHKRPATI